MYIISNIETTNIVDPINGTVAKVRELTIYTLLKFLRKMFQRWFFDQRNVALVMLVIPITKWTNDRLRLKLEHTHHIGVYL